MAPYTTYRCSDGYVAIFTAAERHWERLIAAMLGIIIVRKILTYRLGPQNAVEMVN